MITKKLKEIGINLIGIADALKDTDQNAEINDLLIDLDLLKDELNNLE